MLQITCALLLTVPSFSQTISGGSHHSLFLCQNNTAMSSGWSDFGQLGNIDSYPWPIPSFQIPFPTGVTKVSCGDHHSLFLMSDSTVMSSGFNFPGTLGAGSTDWIKTSPVNVVGLTGIVAVAGSGGHSLFLKSDGTVWSCGTNTNGQLGVGPSSALGIPVQIQGLSNVVAIAAGSACSYFIKSDGTAWACGQNIYGQLGDSTTIDRNTPVQVYGLTDVIAVSSSGVHTLFLKSDGTVWGTGKNSKGELGAGFIWGYKLIPSLSGITGVIGIATGYEHSVFLKNDSTAWTCGNNYYGELGDGTTINHPSPVQVLSGVVNVAAGYTSSIFVKDNGTVWCCGENKYGLAGDAVITNSLVPIQATGLSNITYAHAGKSSHCLFVDNNNAAWGFGKHQYGQLGGYTNPLRLSAVPVTGLSGIKAVCAGREYSLFLMNDSTVWGIGSNYWGELGDSSGIDRTVQPIHIPGLTGVTAISAYELHSLFLKSDSTVWACGINSLGQLGDGTTTNRLAPIQVPGLTGIIAISAGNTYSLFLKSDGTVWACGQNGGGQFANGTTTNSLIPVLATSISGVTAISAGNFHSLFLKNNGTVWACGSNNSGQHGNGTTTNSTIAVQTLIDSVTAIVAVNSFSLFRKSDGTVWACGTNYAGQLGDSTILNSISVPNQVPGISDVVEIEASGSTSWFAKSDGSVWGCGSNDAGQLGDSTIIERQSVVMVQALCYVATPVKEVLGESSNTVIYPNPASSKLYVTVNQKSDIIIYDLLGEIVFRKYYSDNTKNTVELDVSFLTPGIYFVQVGNETGKFVKE